jgi:serine/threonine protein kinase
MQYDSNRGIVLDTRESSRNVVSVDGYDVELTYLPNGPTKGKGGNSYVFQLKSENWCDGFVIKISAYEQDSVGNRGLRLQRFEREIEALKKAKKSGLGEHIVEIICDGVLSIHNFKFRFFVMPKADMNLGVFLGNAVLSLPSKLLLCRNILEAVNRLHGINIYHRDIKPGNFMMFGSTVKVADLGLCTYRNLDDQLDKGDRKIGPFGFLSPEAVNRFCADTRSKLFGKTCSMDATSDLFQLGLLFWFILQGDVPVGQLTLSDLTQVPSKDRAVFEKVILPLLQFDKKRRATYSDIGSVLGELAQP